MIKYNIRICETFQSSKMTTQHLIRSNIGNTIEPPIEPEPPVIPEPTCSPKPVGLLQYVDYDTSVIPETTSVDEGFGLYMSVNGEPFDIYYGSDYIDLAEMFAKKIPSNLPLPRFENNDGIELIAYRADGSEVRVMSYDTERQTDPFADGGVIKRFNIIIKPIPNPINVVDMFISFDGHEAGQIEIETCLGFFPDWIDRPVPPRVESLIEDNSFKTYYSYKVDSHMLEQGLDIGWVFHYSSPIESKLVTYNNGDMGGPLMLVGFPGIGYNVEMSLGMSLDVDHACSHYTLIRSMASLQTDEFVDYMMVMLQLMGPAISDNLIGKYDLFLNYVKSKYDFVKESLTETELQVVHFALDSTSANLLIDFFIVLYGEFMPEAEAYSIRSNWSVEQKKVLYKLVDKPDMIDTDSVNGFDYIKPLMIPANTPFNLKSDWVINFTGSLDLPDL